MKRLVILGGGFAGAKIAKALENYYGTVFIDDKDYFEFTPGILKTIVNPSHAKKIQILHTIYLKKARVIRARVKEITKKEVTLSENNQKIKFDYLIIASGSSYNSPFKEQNIINVSRALQLKKNYNKLCLAKNIVIIGGGIVGVELASEIVEKYKNKNITIIQKSDKLMERNNQKTAMYAKKFFEKKKVKIIYNEIFKKYINKNVLTNKKTKIKADLIFLCTGITSNSSFMKKSMSNFLNERNQITVNKYLQIENNQETINNIFAAGDITDINEEKLAQNAEKQASVIIKNMISLENNKPLAKYNSKPRIMVISLGRFNGILQYKSFVLTGLIPAFLKTFVEFKTMVRYKS